MENDGASFLISSASSMDSFVKSVDASEYMKTGNKIFELLDSFVDEMGEQNVVQVITDSGSNYKLAGQLLEAKRKHLFWNPCAAHCIDLVLEDIGKLDKVKKAIQRGISVVGFIYNHTLVLNMMRNFTSKLELVTHGVTRFAIAFLTLQRLHGVPAMGYIYEATDRAKEAIQNSFKGNEDKYKEIIDIIDKRWHCQLHHALHAAGHFLNPEFYKNPLINNDAEVLDGLYKCIEKLSGSLEMEEKISSELAMYDV